MKSHWFKLFLFYTLVFSGNIGLANVSIDMTKKNILANFYVNPISGWTPEDISLMVVDANRVLSQCNITIMIHEVYWNRNFFVEAGPKQLSTFSNLLKSSNSAGLNILLVNRLSNEFGSAAISARGVISISRYILYPEYIQKRSSEYSVLAHEVGHLLGGLKHLPWPEKNLMSGFSDGVNGSITSEQCQKIRNTSSKYFF